MKEHNWFIIDGEIRLKRSMTEKEFDKLISEIGDFYGLTKHSPTTDSDYNYKDDNET